MAQIYETDEEIERVLLIGVALDDNDEAESSLDELAELAKTAGAVTVGRLIQPREYFHPATYIGKGKLEEVRLMADELDATGIICDDELTPAQLRNLEDVLNLKIMDRTMVILDIFASRANTSEEISKRVEDIKAVFPKECSGEHQTMQRFHRCGLLRLHQSVPKPSAWWSA